LTLAASSCEYRNETSECIKDGGFLDQLSDHQLVKDFAPWIFIFVSASGSERVVSERVLYMHLIGLRSERDSKILIVINGKSI
jgi:hypothetical protein